MPAILVIVLGLAFIADGKPSNIPLSGDALVSNLGLTNLAFLAGAILMFAGMEVAASTPTSRGIRGATSRGRSCWRP